MDFSDYNPSAVGLCYAVHMQKCMLVGFFECSECTLTEFLKMEQEIEVGVKIPKFIEKIGAFKLERNNQFRI